MNYFTKRYDIECYTTVQQEVMASVSLYERSVVDGIDGRALCFPLQAVEQMCQQAGHLRILRENMHAVIHASLRIMEGLAQNESLKIKPTFSIDIQDYGAASGLYVFPQDIICLNVWHVLDSPLEIIHNTLLHEITHWYAVQRYNHFGHGDIFQSSWGELFALPFPETNKHKSRLTIIAEIQRQAENCMKLQRIIA